MVSRPHGGKLTNRVLQGKRRERLLEEAVELPKLNLSFDYAVDVENIARGVFSPLEGFMNQEEYLSVLYNMRLPDDTPWTIPITLDVDPRRNRRSKARRLHSPLLQRRSNRTPKRRGNLRLGQEGIR